MTIMTTYMTMTMTPVLSTRTGKARSLSEESLVTMKMTPVSSTRTATARSLSEPSTSSTCVRNEDCRNGGLCKFSSDTGAYGCECGDRYFGPKCTRYCPLQCKNGGICRFKGDDPGDEHLYLDTNVDHYECKCRGEFTGRKCEASFVACPDGSKCLNGGECAESTKNATAYRCICPYGSEGKRCEGTEETRTFKKGPVTKEPVSDGGIVGIVIASLAIVIAVVLLVRMRRRKAYAQGVREGDHLDDLMMAVSDDEEDENETGMEATTIT